MSAVPQGGYDDQPAGGGLRWLDWYAQAPEGQCEVNAAGVIVGMNQTLLGWLGYRPAEMLGRMAHEALVSEEWHPTWNGLQERCRQEGKIEEVGLALCGKNGNGPLPVRMNAVAVYDAQGRFGGWRGSVWNERTMTYEMEGEGVPVVFIHEVATDHRLWHRQLPYFQARCRMITLDILGQGRVAWPLQEISIEQASRRVQRLLEWLGTGPAFVVGVSMGAAVAMRMALDSPSLVQGLVLVSPWSYSNAHLRSLANRLFRLAEGEDMAAHTELFLRYAFSTAFAERRPLEVERLRAVALQQNPRAVAYTWAACLACDLDGELGGVKAPSLVISGVNDLLTPPYLGGTVAEELPEVELEVWEESGHFPFLEDPGRFNRRLEAFIRHCRTQARSR